MAEGSLSAGSVSLPVKPDTRGFGSLLGRQIVGESKGAGHALGSTILGGLKEFAGPIAATVGGFLAFEGIKKTVEGSVKAFEDAAVSTRTLQRAIGGTAQEVSGYVAAMTFAGVSTDRAQIGLRTFSKNLGLAADDTKKATKLTHELGFSFEDAHGKVLPMSDLLPKLADKFQKMPDGAQKTALAMQLFGKSGADMIPFLNKGSAGIAELTKKAQEMGLVLDDTSIKIFAAARTSLREFQGATKGASIAAGQDFTVAIDGVANIFRAAMIPALGAVTKVFHTLRPEFVQFGEIADKVAEQVRANITPVVDHLAARLAVFVKSGLEKAITGLENFSKATNGFKLDKIGPALEKMIPGFKNLANVFHLMTPLAPILSKALADLGPSIGKVLPNLAKAAVSLLPALEKIIQAILPLIPPLAKVIVALAPVLSKVADAAVWLIKYGLTPMVNLLADVSDALSGTKKPIDVLKDGLSGKLGPAAQSIARILVNVVKPAVDGFMGVLRAAGTGVSVFAGNVAHGFSTIRSLIAAGMGAAGRAVRNEWTAIRTAFSSAFGAINQATGGALGRMVSRVAGGMAAFSGAFRAGLAAVISVVAGGFRQTVTAAAAGINAVINIVRTLPGRARSALGDLGGMLFSSGRALITGFANGIRAGIGAAVAAAHTVVTAVSRLFPHSPALEGPFSGRGWTLYSGHAIGEGLAEGMTQSTPKVRAAALHMTTNAAIIPPAITRASRGPVASVASIAGGAAPVVQMPDTITIRDAKGFIATMEVVAADHVARYDLSTALAGAR